MRKPLLLIPVICTACSSGRVNCHPDDEIDVAAGIAQLDRNGDGALTAEDLEPGEVGAVLSWLGPEGRIGTSVHVTSRSPLVQMGITPDWETAWGVSAFLEDCKQSVLVGAGFMQEDRYLNSVVTGAHEFTGAGLGITEYEVYSFAGSLSQGVVHITDAGPTFSGHLEGSDQVELFSILSEPPAPVGQTVRIEAFAFRDL